MTTIGLTRTCTIRSILDNLERAGGSTSRVFRTAELSPRLVEDPNRLILLKDQFALLAAATREIGDPATAARMAIDAGIDGLGDYGHAIVAEPTLRQALRVARDLLPSTLQTATRVGLSRDGRLARWSYSVDDPSLTGRHENEVLCAGYVLGVLRRFGGPRWTPQRVVIAGRPMHGRRAIEQVLDCSIEPGDVTSVDFPLDMLDCQNLGRLGPGPLMRLPVLDNPAALVAEVIGSALPGGRPSLIATARRLGKAPRSLQRQLRACGTSFEQVLDRSLAAQAKRLLRSGKPVTFVGYELGFAEPSHFSRAFRRWTGSSPKAWQRRNPS